MSALLLLGILISGFVYLDGYTPARAEKFSLSIPAQSIKNMHRFNARIYNKFLEQHGQAG